MDQDQYICQSIVHALKRGLVPAHGLDRIVVGRDSELRQLRRDLEFGKSGGGWVRFVSGDYGMGKTFLCSLVREVAWHEGFVVAALDLGRDAPLHKCEVIYHRVVDGMRTDHFRDVPAFEFIVQEWLFNLEQDVQGSMGLDAAHPEQRGEIARIVEQQIKEQLLGLQIYDSSLANAMHAYYVASQQGHKPLAAAAAGWLKGESNAFAELCQKFDVRGATGKDNAFDFLQAMATLIVHIGYAGLIVLCDEAESIRGISRPDSRNAAYENISFLMDKTAQGAFAHCGFLFSGTEDFFRDDRRGVASHRALYDRLQSNRGKRQTKDPQQAILRIEGFDQRKLHEVALKVRDVHGIAHAWDAAGRMTDALLKRLVEDTAVRFGKRLNTMPRGFLKSLVDILDEVERNPHHSAAEIVAAGIDADHIEEIEREEAHLLDYT